MNSAKIYFMLIFTVLIIMAYYHVYLEKANLTQRKLDAPHEGGERKENLQSNSVLIYNRVPKTGSTSLMNIAYELFSNNG